MFGSTILDVAIGLIFAYFLLSMIASHINEAIAATAQAQPASLPQLMNTIGQFNLGWGKLPQDVGGWLQKIIGLAITTLAVSLGAPFWFDVLKNLANMRNTGPAPQPAEPSKKA